MTRPAILLVEDNPIARKMFHVVMEAEGFAVIEAGNGAAAIERMGAAPADLVLLDMVLPDMDGGELAGHLRALPGGARVKVVAMSGFQGLLDDARGRPDLFDGYLCKPIEPAQLIQMLGAQLPAVSLTPDLAALGAGRHILVVDDDPVQLKLARVHLDRHFGRISTAIDGVSALAQARSAPPDLILSDVMMPNLDGFELCLTVRRDPALAHIPVVLVSAQPADDADADLARRVGASALLARTSDFEDLVPAILALFGGPREGGAAVAGARRSGAPSMGSPELLRLDHSERARRQLERQLVAQSEVERREARLGAQLAILSGVADALTRSADIEATLRDVLAACLDAGGVDRCALYREDGEVPRLTHVLGFPETDRAEIAAVFGHPILLSQVLADARVTPIGAPLLGEEEARGVLLRAGVTSAMFIPLIGAGRCVGALLVGMQGAGPDQGQLAFVRAVGAYLGQALELAEAFARQRAARIAAEEANRAKDEFLAMLGHELRNPLTPIRNAVNLLRLRGRTDPVLDRARDVIDRQVEHIARLIDDLLDIARISHGKLLLRKERLDLGALCRTTVEDYHSALEAAGLSLSLRLPEAPLWVDGDPTRLHEALGNLLHNAIKFTGPGGSVRLTLDAPPGGDARVTVEDDGVGIEQELLSRLFQPFTQADRSIDRSKGGLGLGLSLVRSLVHLHGGQVSVESDGPGRGARFTVRLPLLEDPGPAPQRDGAPDAASAAPRRILVIEDNLDICDTIRDVLQALGHQVQIACSGHDGVALAQGFLPELVLCDIGLPGGMDGYAVARALRQEPTLASTRLIALTGYGQKSDRARALEAGFDQHVTKPLEFDKLMEVLASPPARAAAGAG